MITKEINKNELLNQIEKFQEKMRKNIIWDTNNKLIQIFKIWRKAIKENTQWVKQGPSFIYKILLEEYNTIAPVAEELGKEIENIDKEKKEQIDFLNQYPDITTQDRDYHESLITTIYNRLAEEIMPVRWKIIEMEEIIEKFQRFSDENQQKNEEQENLFAQFRNNMNTISKAMMAYQESNKMVNDQKKEVENKYEKK